MAVAGRARTGFSRKALLLAPFLWVAVELLRAHLVSFPWMLLGTAQIDNLPLTRLASLTGVYGVSFEIALVNTVFAAAMLVHRKRRMPLLVAALAGASRPAVHGPGARRAQRGGGARHAGAAGCASRPAMELRGIQEVAGRSECGEPGSGAGPRNPKTQALRR